MIARIASYVVWLLVGAAVVAAQHGATRWIVGALFVLITLSPFISKLVARLRKKRSRPRARTPPATSPLGSLEPAGEQPPASPAWGLSLLVDADDATGVLCPSVQFVGPRTPAKATVSLHVIDGAGDVRLTAEREFSYPGMATDLALAPLALPEGASADEAAGWEWHVTLSDRGEELVRCCGPLAGAGSLNDEAELEVLDLPRLEGPAPAGDLEALLELLTGRG